MVLAATVLLIQFAAIQPSVPTTGLNEQSQSAVVATASAGQKGSAFPNALAASNPNDVERLGVGSLSHVHILILVIASTSQPSPASHDGSSSPGFKAPAAAEGAGSMGIIAAPVPAAPLPPFKAGPNEIRKTSRMWAVLTIAQHIAATFDAWSTRHALSAGGRYEADPMMRPFANSPAIYGAIQAGPVVLDYVGRRMSRSQSKWMQRLWWVPQSAATAGFLFSGSHNVIHSR
jgi:hypothetical protein